MDKVSLATPALFTLNLHIFLQGIYCTYVSSNKLKVTINNYYLLIFKANPTHDNQNEYLCSYRLMIMLFHKGTKVHVKNVQHLSSGIIATT